MDIYHNILMIAVSLLLTNDNVVQGAYKECGSILTGEGEFQSHGYPRAYPSNYRCEWTFQAEEGDSVDILFTDFQIEESPQCRYDSLQIFAMGYSPKFCGEGVQKVGNNGVLSVKGEVKFLMTSDAEDNFKGFSVRYRITPKPTEAPTTTEPVTEAPTTPEPETEAPVTPPAPTSCAEDPCKNGGDCIDVEEGEIFCFCADGYEGTYCEINIDDCESSPCENGGTCIDGVNEFKCECPIGFLGDLCGVDIDECQGQPCKNNGTCIDGPNSFECECAQGFTGWNCGQDMDECESGPCQNMGVCEDFAGYYNCICYPGFTGVNCEIPPPTTTPAPTTAAEETTTPEITTTQPTTTIQMTTTTQAPQPITTPKSVEPETEATPATTTTTSSTTISTTTATILPTIVPSSSNDEHQPSDEGQEESDLENQSGPGDDNEPDNSMAPDDTENADSLHEETTVETSLQDFGSNSTSDAHGNVPPPSSDASMSPMSLAGIIIGVILVLTLLILAAYFKYNNKSGTKVQPTMDLLKDAKEADRPQSQNLDEKKVEKTKKNKLLAENGKKRRRVKRQVKDSTDSGDSDSTDSGVTSSHSTAQTSRGVDSSCYGSGEDAGLGNCLPRERRMSGDYKNGTSALTCLPNMILGETDITNGRDVRSRACSPTRTRDRPSLAVRPELQPITETSNIEDTTPIQSKQILNQRQNVADQTIVGPTSNARASAARRLMLQISKMKKDNQQYQDENNDIFEESHPQTFENGAFHPNEIFSDVDAPINDSKVIPTEGNIMTTPKSSLKEFSIDQLKAELEKRRTNLKPQEERPEAAVRTNENFMNKIAEEKINKKKHSKKQSHSKPFTVKAKKKHKRRPKTVDIPSEETITNEPRPKTSANLGNVDPALYSQRLPKLELQKGGKTGFVNPSLSMQNPSSSTDQHQRPPFEDGFFPWQTNTQNYNNAFYPGNQQQNIYPQNPAMFFNPPPFPTPNHMSNVFSPRHMQNISTPENNSLSQNNHSQNNGSLSPDAKSMRRPSDSHSHANLDNKLSPRPRTTRKRSIESHREAIRRNSNTRNRSRDRSPSARSRPSTSISTIDDVFDSRNPKSHENTSFPLVTRIQATPTVFPPNPRNLPKLGSARNDATFTPFSQYPMNFPSLPGAQPNYYPNMFNSNYFNNMPQHNAYQQPGNPRQENSDKKPDFAREKAFVKLN